MSKLTLTPGRWTLAELRRIARGHVPLALDPAAAPAIRASADTVGRILAGGRTVYGINTGFGILAKTRIDTGQLQELQTRLILSHSAGTGAPLDDAVVRLILALKVGGLARGHSGVRLELIEAILKLYNAEIYPVIPAKGSVGASGDLAPLAHMSLALLGHGQVRMGGQTMPAAEGLKRAGLAPIELGPKEGLALINGTQVSTALALTGLFAAEDVFLAAVCAGALSVDAAAGSDTPFDPRIHDIRGQRGQSDVAAVYLKLMRNSAIRSSHVEGDDRVQDPYCLRCQPQVMGACLDQIRFAAATMLAEANAVSDNPLVFAADGDILSGGNFHGEPVAMAADNLALAIAETGALSERRVALLIDPHMSGLPAFLVAAPGINSGFMIAQVTAAALASENKSLAHPASVDSLPTSANQEDHVSMATFAARRTIDMADNTSGIVAIELLAAAQGVDMRRPLETSPAAKKVLAAVRAVAPFFERDREFAPVIAAVKSLIANGGFNAMVDSGLVPSI
ncbi:MAG: histidine ammonia-lyase [Alphaproteobacteria bacterium]|nr:histidine ammonia-lyase [Alphaproteobacteria bacterium]